MPVRPAGKEKSRPAGKRGKGLSEETVAQMVITGFAVFGSLRPAQLRQLAPDLWDMSEAEADTIAKPATRLLQRVPAKYSDLIENALDPFLLIMALRASFGDRLDEERRMVNAIRAARVQGQGAPPGAGGFASPAGSNGNYAPDYGGAAGPVAGNWPGPLIPDQQ